MVIWGHSMHFFIEQTRWKLGPRGEGGVCGMNMSIFDLEYGKVILIRLVHFLQNWLAIQKRLIIEWNGQKYGSRILLTLNMQSLVWCYSMQFSQNWLVTQKRLIVD